ncbi:related to calcineurin temperature suppressor cts1 [Sporisorium reilianum SRZ2]|uniref:Related to calcineurin temperature suppressor cts1 n=1 Tax=Sporisorium reilianum (strain SRZ2) TaxID=999809 RepID=E6ZWH6_SPORE|nr:related to calcineurin temperature suppressor cts1 [Sporisorium reilianum SRZ2]
MPASAEPVHKGTLVCVVLKARNLPNKKSIGKQDPYTVLSMGQEQQKTKPDKRGGQHPTWDEQLHFEIYEDLEDALTSASTTNGTGSGSKATSAKAKGGKKVLKVACYADDSKEPEFIGEGIVDLTDTLKTGEFDEWVTIKAKDRYAGEVYLELTFYSSAAPPKKRRPSTQPKMSGTDTYGGAGSFQRIDEARDAASSGSGSGAPPKPAKGKGDHPPIPASMRPGGSSASNTMHGRMSSSVSSSSLASSLHRPPSSMSHSQTMHDLGSTTLRPSSSLANLDAYTPAYAPASISRSTSPVPPSSMYHSANHASSIGPTAGGSRRNSLATPVHAGGSRRNSFAAPMPSEFGHSITPSASYYSQHSMTPSQSIQYLPNNHAPEPSDDRYVTVRPGTIAHHHHQHRQNGVPRSHSISHIPIAYNTMPQPDYGADQLTHSMSQMGFGHSTVTADKLFSPPTPSPADDRPPQSHIYQAPAHLASLYTPPPNAGYAQDVQRPVSPAARPASALSQYSTSASPHVNATPSVVNAQAYYQQQQQQPPPPPPATPQAGGHLAQPPSVPPRSSSPGVVAAGYTPIPSPYSQPSHQSHAPRPLPSTQSSTALSSMAPAQLPAQQPPQPQKQQQHAAYASHLYQPVQQPSPPPQQPQQLPHSGSQSFSNYTWHGPPPAAPASQPPPAQPAYGAAAGGAPNGTAGVPPSLSSGYLYSAPAQAGGEAGAGWTPGRSPSPLPPIPAPQPQPQPQPQHLPSSGSMHGFYPSAPAPAPAVGYAHVPQPGAQAYQPYHAAQSAYAPQQYAPPQQQQQQQQQQHYATVSAGSGQHQGGLSQSFSSSLLYQAHQNSQYHHQQGQGQYQ